MLISTLSLPPVISETAAFSASTLSSLVTSSGSVVMPSATSSDSAFTVRAVAKTWYPDAEFSVAGNKTDSE